ncbi:MAG: tRNA uridine-5-carboxymethylaminomethyl(34) synthesis GTPase MnmE [Eubacteriales bacterium]|nr:tRNA uridine-5-carboxymethylaminomethyl(34) synthesis GTPase MnmE [Eubacteriales bacterium]
MALPIENREQDTICAVATAMSEAGIGIIRISGPRAFEIGNRLYRNHKKEQTLLTMQPNTIRFGYLVEPDRPQEIVDEVMISLMKGPHSYTTEDTVEINSHGGLYLLNRILDCVLRCGARLAQPGEFTKRAFLGGRLDLAEAEAVMDLISSQNEFARKNSISQLEGSVSAKIREMREAVLYELAFIESALDDPENYDMEGYPERLRVKLGSVLAEMEELLSRSEEGRILREGIRTVIVGKPNAGKSSLLNDLSGTERAIVTEVPGTTRDTLEESVRVNGVLLHLIDTAGIRETEDTVEKIGIERARRSAQEADLLLYLIDTSSPLSQEDTGIAELVREAVAEGKRAIVLLNKSDLEPKVTRQEAEALFACGCKESAEESAGCDNLVRDSMVQSSAQEIGKPEAGKLHFLSISVKNREGMEELRAEIGRLFHAGELLQSSELYLTNLRHREALLRAKNALELVIGSIDEGMSEDFYSIDLMNSYAALGEIIGEQVDDDLVEEIFSKFCLGK